MSQVLIFINKPVVWIWPLFAIILWVGLRRTKPTLSKIRTLLLLPTILLALSLKRMIGLSINKVSVLSWLGGVVVGGMLGWLLTRNKVVCADHDHGLVYLPGSWATLISLVIIFFSRYYFSSRFAAEPDLRHSVFYVALSLSVMGFFLGSFTGRVVGHIHQYRKAASMDLRSITSG